MHFQLLHLILWPLDDQRPRVVDFEPGMVNVITGASKTGKSAVVPIIDYCLGATRCAIPVGVIRERCSWFGVIVETAEGQKLFARRAPDDQRSTSDMYVLEGDSIAIPQRILEKNTNLSGAKDVLNRISGLSRFSFEPGERGFKSAPSFRDLAAFVFQPQNVVANPDVLFFKADTTEHRERLKLLFPYLLGAVTDRTLLARHALESLQRQLRKVDSDLRALGVVNDRWKRDGQAWLRQAMSLGLVPPSPLSDDWAELRRQLTGLLELGGGTGQVTQEGLDVPRTRLQELRVEERKAMDDVATHRRQLNALDRLRASADSFGDALEMQRERLALSDWLDRRVSAPSDPLVVASGLTDDHLRELRHGLAVLEVQTRAAPTLTGSLDEETLLREQQLRAATERLQAASAEIKTLEDQAEATRKAREHGYAVERFLGRVEQAIALYAAADAPSPLMEQAKQLRKEISQLRREVDEVEIARRLDEALERVHQRIAAIVPRLDGEWPEAPVRLNTQELTVQVEREGREDFLWEIGSGANWLAYHVATTLALQQFFLEKGTHPVPALLVYDQPSQVYFPKRAAGPRADAEEDMWAEHDIAQVRKVFKVLNDAVDAASGRLQVVVMDHAHADVWGNLPFVGLCQEWRDGVKLVPIEWLDSPSGQGG